MDYVPDRCPASNSVRPNCQQSNCQRSENAARHLSATTRQDRPSGHEGLWQDRQCIQHSTLGCLRGSPGGNCTVGGVSKFVFNPHGIAGDHPHLQQPLQPPGNAKTLRQHTGCLTFFGFKGGHDVVVWVRSRVPACKCTLSPSLPSVESPLYHSVSTSAIIL